MGEGGGCFMVEFSHYVYVSNNGSSAVTARF